MQKILIWTCLLQCQICLDTSCLKFVSCGKEIQYVIWIMQEFYIHPCVQNYTNVQLLIFEDCFCYDDMKIGKRKINNKFMQFHCLLLFVLLNISFLPSEILKCSHCLAGIRFKTGLVYEIRYGILDNRLL